MKIKKFNENETPDLSTDFADEIVKNLTELLTYIDEKNKTIDSFINELNNFRSSKKSTNDQIDDSIANLQLIRGSFTDVVDKIDNVVNNMKDYNKSGRKYIY
jgi:ABC-type transporter Mla subunit MlaD